MSGTTTNYAIPYPTGTDTPCSLDDTLSDAADAICAMLATVGAVVDHAVDRPVVKVSAGAGQTIALGVAGAYSTWTSVDIDTLGIVDLVAEDQALAFPVGYDGVYLTGLQVNAPGVNAGGPVVYVRTLDNRHTTGDETGSSGTIGAAVCVMERDYSNFIDTMTLSTSGAATSVSPTHAELYMISISD